MKMEVNLKGLFWCQGENRFIESVCQTIFSTKELLDIMTNPKIDNNLKRPYLRFLLWVYLNTAGGMIESGAGDLPHDRYAVVTAQYLKKRFKLCGEERAGSQVDVRASGKASQQCGNWFKLWGKREHRARGTLGPQASHCSIMETG